MTVSPIMSGGSKSSHNIEEVSSYKQCHCVFVLPRRARALHREWDVNADYPSRPSIWAFPCFGIIFSHVSKFLIKFFISHNHGGILVSPSKQYRDRLPDTAPDRDSKMSCRKKTGSWIYLCFITVNSHKFEKAVTKFRR